MTANPYRAEAGNASSIGNFGRDLEPGETRTILRPGRPPLIVYRTTRTYAEDLRDAYNDGRSARALEDGLLWVLTPDGALRLTQDDAWTRAHLKRLEATAESERARATRHSLEAIRRARNEPGGGEDDDEN
jgi:hypothetical protein